MNRRLVSQRLFTAATLGGAVACSAATFDAPKQADASGTYTIAVTEKNNDCQLNGWTEGTSSQNIPFTLSQQGTDATGHVDGLVGSGMALWLGNNSFVGNLQGPTLSLTDYGTRSDTASNCSFTVNARVDGTVQASAGLISGTITYSYATNGSPDCGYRTTCTSVQSFSGNKPPS